MFDIPLMLISMLVFGGGFGTRTVLAALYTPGFMNVLTRLVYPNPEAVESLDPSLLLGGSVRTSSNDLLLTCVIGAVVIGVGQGIVVRQQATTGGTDIVAMLLAEVSPGIKFSTGIPPGRRRASILSGLGRDRLRTRHGRWRRRTGWVLTLYSLITIYISFAGRSPACSTARRTTSCCSSSATTTRSCRRFIIDDLDRSATYIKAQGHVHRFGCAT